MLRIILFLTTGIPLHYMLFQIIDRFYVRILRQINICTDKLESQFTGHNTGQERNGHGFGAGSGSRLSLISGLPASGTTSVNDFSDISAVLLQAIHWNLIMLYATLHRLYRLTWNSDFNKCQYDLYFPDKILGNNTRNMNTAAASGSLFTPTAANGLQEICIACRNQKVKFRARRDSGNNLFVDNICKIKHNNSSGCINNNILSSGIL